MRTPGGDDPHGQGRRPMPPVASTDDEGQGAESDAEVENGWHSLAFTEDHRRVSRRRYVARGVPGGYRIFDNRAQLWWGTSMSCVLTTCWPNSTATRTINGLPGFS